MSTQTQTPHRPSRRPTPAAAPSSGGRYRIVRWVGVGAVVALVAAIGTLLLRETEGTTDPRI